MTGISTYLSALLIVSVPVWLGLVGALYKLLASKHPDKYRQMGMPRLVGNKAPGAGVRLIKFVFTREDRPLNDPQLTRLTAFLFGFSIWYGVLILFGIVEVLLIMLQLRGS